MTAAVTSQVLYADALLKVLQRLRDRYKDMTMLQGMAYFIVAQNPGIGQSELYEALDTSASAASRILAVLSDYGNRNAPGLDLVRVTPSKSDKRLNIVFLTAKGTRVMEDIIAEIRRVAKADKQIAS